MMRETALVIMLSLAAGALAAEPLPPALDSALDRALTFLSRQQKPDGSFDGGVHPNAMTGLGILAFLSCGHTPDAGRHAQVLRDAVDYLVRQNARDGYFGQDGGRMYSHAIATLALAQVHGTENDPAQQKAVFASLERALRVLLEAQDAARGAPVHAGGWCYEPRSNDSDLSVTVWGVMALRACQNAGLDVPRQRLDRALTYVLRCYRPEQRGFAYQPGGEASASMTGAALVALILSGLDHRPEVGPAIRFLIEKPVRENAPHFHYALYYTAHAALLAGDQPGRAAWSSLWRNAHEQLLESQRKEDGSFPRRRDDPGADNRPGRFYSTAMAVLTLSAPLRLLPAYQQ
jgi:hypothetical protein